MIDDFEPFTLPKKPQGESDIERAVCEYAKSTGVLHYKFSSPGHKSVPDRIFLYREIILFIEFKAPNKHATAAQLREHERIRGQGFQVEVVDNIEDGKRFINWMLFE